MRFDADKYAADLIARVGLQEAQVLALAWQLKKAKPETPDEICISAARWIAPSLYERYTP